MRKMDYLVTWDEVNEFDSEYIEEYFSTVRKKALLKFLQRQIKNNNVSNLCVYALDYDADDTAYQRATEIPVADYTNISDFIAQLQLEVEGNVGYTEMNVNEILKDKTVFRLLIKVVEDTDEFTDFDERDLRRYLRLEDNEALPKAYKVVEKQKYTYHRTTKGIPQKTIIHARQEINEYTGDTVYIPDEQGSFSVIVPQKVITDKTVFEKAFNLGNVTSFSYDEAKGYYTVNFEKEFVVYELDLNQIVTLASHWAGVMRMWKTYYCTGRMLRYIYDEEGDEILRTEIIPDGQEYDVVEVQAEVVDYVKIELEIGWS